MDKYEVVFLAIYTPENKLNSEHLGLELLQTVLTKNNIKSIIKVLYTNIDLNDQSYFEDFISTSTKLIGVTVDFNTISFVDYLAKSLKYVYPNIHITSGGNYATQMKMEILNKCSSIDSVLLGEAERTIILLWKSLQRNNFPELCECVVFKNTLGEYVLWENKVQLSMFEVPHAARLLNLNYDNLVILKNVHMRHPEYFSDEITYTGDYNNTYKIANFFLPDEKNEKETEDKTQEYSNFFVKIPRLKEQFCVSCNECVRLCPAQAIKQTDDYPIFDADSCINCCCCHEMCLYSAIKMVRSINL